MVGFIALACTMLLPAPPAMVMLLGGGGGLDLRRELGELEAVHPVIFIDSRCDELGIAAPKGNLNQRAIAVSFAGFAEALVSHHRHGSQAMVNDKAFKYPYTAQSRPHAFNADDRAANWPNRVPLIKGFQVILCSTVDFASARGREIAEAEYRLRPPCEIAKVRGRGLDSLLL